MSKAASMCLEGSGPKGWEPACAVSTQSLPRGTPSPSDRQAQSFPGCPSIDKKGSSSRRILHWTREAHSPKETWSGRDGRVRVGGTTSCLMVTSCLGKEAKFRFRGLEAPGKLSSSTLWEGAGRDRHFSQARTLSFLFSFSSFFLLRTIYGSHSGAV